MKQSESSQLSPDLEKLRQKVGDKEFAQVLEQAQKQIESEAKGTLAASVDESQVKQLDETQRVTSEKPQSPEVEVQAQPINKIDRSGELEQLVHALIVKGEGRLMDSNGKDDGAADTVNAVLGLGDKEK